MKACNCIGPQNFEPFCPCMMTELGIFKRDGKWLEPEKVVGIVKKPTMPFSEPADACHDFRHNPPMGLYMEPGESYVHTCPSCAARRTITQNFTFSEEEGEDAFAAESDDEILTKMGR